MARRRHLMPEEQDLWHSVARTVTPRLGKISFRALEIPPAAPPLREDSGPRPAPTPLPAFRLGEKAKSRAPGHDLSPGLADRPGTAPLQMDAKTHGKIGP